MKLLPLFLLLSITFSSFAEEVPQSIKDMSASFMAYGQNPKLIEAVKAQNKQNLALAEIKSRDKKWIDTDGIDSFMTSLLENDAAKALFKIEGSQPYYLELFLMDNQGANVAMTNKTGDYWQGDEDKFQKSYNSGKGDLHVGEVEFDESAQAYLVQVSVPVMDGPTAIGALTIGVNLDELE